MHNFATRRAARSEQAPGRKEFPSSPRCARCAARALLPKDKGSTDDGEPPALDTQRSRRRGRYTGMPPIVRHMTYRARALRQAATSAEKLLWDRVRARRLDGFKFRRQQPLGPYVVDFFCEQAAICIEADGQQHYPSPPSELQRDRLLTGSGLLVLRFPNDQILRHTDQVVRVIREALRQRCPGGPL